MNVVVFDAMFASKSEDDADELFCRLRDEGFNVEINHDDQEWLVKATAFWESGRKSILKQTVKEATKGLQVRRVSGGIVASGVAWNDVEG